METGVTLLSVFPAIHFTVRPIQSKCKYLHTFVSITSFFLIRIHILQFSYWFFLNFFFFFVFIHCLFLPWISTYSTIFIYIMWHVHVQIFAYQNRFQTKCRTLYEIGLNLCACVCACVCIDEAIYVHTHRSIDKHSVTKLFYQIQMLNWCWTDCFTAKRQMECIFGWKYRACVRSCTSIDWNQPQWLKNPFIIIWPFIWFTILFNFLILSNVNGKNVILQQI